MWKFTEQPEAVSEMEGEPGRQGGLGSHGENDLATRKKGGIKGQVKENEMQQGGFDMTQKNKRAGAIKSE